VGTLPGRNEVQVWWLDLSAAAEPLERAASRLTAAERERYARLLTPESQRRRIRARAGLREILGSLLDRAPHDVGITLAPGGKPQIADTHLLPAISFNLSHSADVAAVAISARVAVGIDIESLARHEVSESVIARVLTAEERAEVDRRPEAERTRAFLQRWTVKEAYLKGLGDGLRREPASVTVLTDMGPLRIRDGRIDGNAGWSVQQLDAPAGVIGAVAAPGGPFVVTERRWAAPDGNAQEREPSSAGTTIPGTSCQSCEQ
jgi:4'-phosphopantetheinyl transferase